MPQLNEIIRTNQDVMAEIVAGTHATETYNDNNEYQVELESPIYLGMAGSGTTINEDDELVVGNLDASVVTSGTFDAGRIPNLPLTKINSVTATASELNVLDGITATTTELNYCDGVTSNIQTQLNKKPNVSFSLSGTTLTITST